MGGLSDILAQLEPSLGSVGGEPSPLEGGITNRNFRVEMGESEYVVRLHGKDTDLLGISRESERLAGEAAARLGIAPRVCAEFEGGLVTQFVSCTALEAPQVAERAGEIGRALRAFHDCGLRLPVEFWVPDQLEAYAGIVAGRGARIPRSYEQAAQIARRIAAALPPWTPRPCHNDLLAGNIISSQPLGNTMIVDWEYAGMGHPCFDLGNLAVNNDFGEADEALLLSAYHGAEPSSKQLAQLHLMRVLSDVREGAWGIMQAQVSELDFDFEGYAEEHFVRMRSVVESEDFERRLAEAKG